jgi:hypothetical protein
MWQDAYMSVNKNRIYLAKKAISAEYQFVERMI